MKIAELFDISGKIAVITGGGRGIGKTIADIYGEAGAKVVITGRREQWLDPTIEEFKAKGYDCLSIKSDVSKPEDCELIINTTLEKYGKIDILVNNAGMTWGAPTEDLPLDKWHLVMDTNLTSVFVLSKLAGKHMIERGAGGRIINISSMMGMGSDPESAKMIAYNTSKAGIIAFTRTLAKEWGEHNILVNAIAPGWFPTRLAGATIEANRERFENQAAVGRIGELEDLKGVALLLAAPASNYITGQVMVVDGGFSL
jgi:gluconate 5-dehydrogenase